MRKKCGAGGRCFKEAVGTSADDSKQSISADGYFSNTAKVSGAPDKVIF